MLADKKVCLLALLLRYIKLTEQIVAFAKWSFACKIPTTLNSKLSPEMDGGTTLVISGNLGFIQENLKFLENWPQYAVDQIWFTSGTWFYWERNQHKQMDLSGLTFIGD